MMKEKIAWIMNYVKVNPSFQIYDKSVEINKSQTH